MGARRQLRVLDHPEEEECVSGQAARTSLQNAQGNAHSAVLSTHCAKVKSNHERILMPY